MKVAGGKLRKGFVYMKFFKDVGTADVDMLVPGARVRSHLVTHTITHHYTRSHYNGHT